MLRIIIIDDEAKARKAVRDIIQFADIDCQIVAEGDNVKNGLEHIHRFNPDLVLLDIDMPDGTGFDLVKQIQNPQFKVIFITAFEDYAIKAFEFSAINYILKPIDPVKLIHALNQAHKMITQEEMQLKLNALYVNLDNSGSSQNKLVIHTTDKMHVVNIPEIVRCNSEGSYTTIHLASGLKILVSKNLKTYEKLLLGKGFYRTHQSHIINLNYIDYYFKHDGGFIVMKDQSRIPVSKRKREPFLKQIEDT